MSRVGADTSSKIIVEMAPEGQRLVLKFLFLLILHIFAVFRFREVEVSVERKY